MGVSAWARLTPMPTVGAGVGVGVVGTGVTGVISVAAGVGDECRHVDVGVVDLNCFQAYISEHPAVIRRSR